MGRTKRKRKRKIIFNDDLSNVISLQKSMKLKCGNLQISYFEDTGRGVKCKKKIHKGDVLITLPLQHLITTKSSCDIFSILDVKNQPPQLFLSILLVYENHLKTESEYFKYIQSLPKFYTNLYFCLKEEQTLLPPFMRDALATQSSSLEKVFNSLTEILSDKLCCHCGTPLKDIYSHTIFIWAWFTVNTRSVYYQDDGNSASLALAPLLDMFNHSNDAVTEMSIDLKKNEYVLKTLVEYRKFQQVFIKYGCHSNLKLLLEYGFIVPENPHDFVEFSFQEVVKCVSDYNLKYGDITKLKYQFIKANKLNQNLTKNKEEFSWNFNGLIYVLITNDQSLSLLQSKTYSNNFSLLESNIIQKIKEIVIDKKYKELNDTLIKMGTYEKCSPSFKMAKNLLSIYLDLLQPS